MVCDLFSKVDLYDRWVVPHQILPFVLTMFGVDYRLVLLLVYVWETIEVFLMHCLQLFEVEDVTDTIISDPIQGFLGVCAAMVLLKINGHSTILNEPFDVFNFKHLIHFILLASPGLTMLNQVYDINLHWLYPVALCAVVILVYRLNKKSYKHGLMMYINIISLSVLTFSIKTFNSFYLGVIWGICFIFILIVFKL